MKSFIFSEETYRIHRALLKSILLTLSLLPLTGQLEQLWQMTGGSSQIILGFFALTLLSALLSVCFYTALKVSLLPFSHLSDHKEQWIFRIYRLLPMWFLVTMLAYLSYEWI